MAPRVRGLGGIGGRQGSSRTPPLHSTSVPFSVSPPTNGSSHSGVRLEPKDVMVTVSEPAANPWGAECHRGDTGTGNSSAVVMSGGVGRTQRKWPSWRMKG